MSESAQSNSNLLETGLVVIEPHGSSVEPTPEWAETWVCVGGVSSIGGPHEAHEDGREHGREVRRGGSLDNLAGCGLRELGLSGEPVQPALFDVAEPDLGVTFGRACVRRSLSSRFGPGLARTDLGDLDETHMRRFRPCSRRCRSPCLSGAPVRTSRNRSTCRQHLGLCFAPGRPFDPGRAVSAPCRESANPGPHQRRTHPPFKTACPHFTLLPTEGCSRGQL